MIDGHGGRAAVEYAAENLGKNIVKALENIEDSRHGENEVEAAIRGGYKVTDEEFLSMVSNLPGSDTLLNVSTTLLKKIKFVLTRSIQKNE